MATSNRSPRTRRPKAASRTRSATRPATRPAARSGAKPTNKSSAKPAAAAGSRRPKEPRNGELLALEKLVLGALEDLKAVNIKVLDVRGLTDVADTMIVASGTSDRHVRAIAENVTVTAKAAGRRPMGTEGKQDGEWVLVDLQDVLVHVMLPRVREFYALEQLWEAPRAQRRRSAGKPRQP
mgnify:CR=1 FL=1